MKQASMLRPLAAVIASVLITGCVTPPAADATLNAPASTISANAAVAPHAAYEQDRQAILAMAGDYKVTFDFIETVAFADGYKLKDRKVSGADEIVRVIEDTGDFISLQHILLVGGEDKFVVKHWRQDWRYQPNDVLIYVGGNAWEMRELTAGQTAGKWSQTVYQVDDSPRYGALGAWTHENGVSAWTPPAEWRPLPRRDATTRDDYHTVDAINVHALTPLGWVHEQNNSKVNLKGEPQTLVREVGVNTYERLDDFNASAGDDYWALTKDYWAGVRTEWSALEGKGAFGLTLQGEPEDLYVKLLKLADDITNGEIETAPAIDEARQVIAAYTTTNIGSLADRLKEAEAQKIAKAKAEKKKN